MAEFLYPYTDFGFYKLFGDDPAPSARVAREVLFHEQESGALGSRQEASKPHLLDFLNTVLPPSAQIEQLSFEPLGSLPTVEARHTVAYDVYCKGVDGTYFIVELQKVAFDYFGDRVLFYETFPIHQLMQENKWNYLTPVYCVGVLGFAFRHPEQDFYQVLHTIKLGSITFIYLEKPNFKKRLDELETRLDQWLYFINHLEEFETHTIPKVFNDQVFLGALEATKISYLDQKGRDQYQQSLKVYRDIYSVRQTIIEETKQRIKLEQHAKMQAENTKIGKEVTLRIAMKLIEMGMSLELIQSATKLENSELEELYTKH